MLGGYNIGLWLLLITTTVTDLLWGKIYNVTIALFLILGLGTQLIQGGTAQLLPALNAVFIAFVLFFPLYLAKVFSGGDVKLIMAIGSWTSPTEMLNLAAIAILVGAIVGLALILFKKFKMRTLTKMPFAPALLCAYLLFESLGKKICLF
jgi:prepilin peptidase CpaA